MKTDHGNTNPARERDENKLTLRDCVAGVLEAYICMAVWNGSNGWLAFAAFLLFGWLWIKKWPKE
jgi:hypothetical protein